MLPVSEFFPFNWDRIFYHGNYEKNSLFVFMFGMPTHQSKHPKVHQMYIVHTLAYKRKLSRGYELKKCVTYLVKLTSK
jgi:hypothetical protein